MSSTASSSTRSTCSRFRTGVRTTRHPARTVPAWTCTAAVAAWVYGGALSGPSCAVACRSDTGNNMAMAFRVASEVKHAPQRHRQRAFRPRDRALQCHCCFGWRANACSELPPEARPDRRRARRATASWPRSKPSPPSSSSTVCARLESVRTAPAAGPPSPHATVHSCAAMGTRPPACACVRVVGRGASGAGGGSRQARATPARS